MKPPLRLKRRPRPSRNPNPLLKVNPRFSVPLRRNPHRRSGCSGHRRRPSAHAPVDFTDTTFIVGNSKTYVGRITSSEEGNETIDGAPVVSPTGTAVRE